MKALEERNEDQALSKNDVAERGRQSGDRGEHGGWGREARGILLIQHSKQNRSFHSGGERK